MPPEPPPAAPPAEVLQRLLQARRTVLPRRLGAPGPDEGQLCALLAAAAHAPDHGQLLPWRFILVPPPARAALAEAFVAALLERDPAADAQAQARAAEKAHRAPVLLLVVVHEEAGDPDIPAAERVLSAGCALQNVLLAATAGGWGSALTSGRALGSAALRRLFALAPGERALCFLSLGCVLAERPPRTRPGPERYLYTLVPGEGTRRLLS